MRRFAPLLLGISLSFGQTQEPQPETLKRMTLEELSQLEVTTPSKEPVRAFQTPAAVFVITADDIRRSGATTIPEALRMAPGIEVARIDASRWSIGIRGFGTRFTRAVLVLIDGRSVYSSLLAGTYWEVQDTLLTDIDRIEVIRGPGGTIWGPNAVNGVINIITRSSKETRGELAEIGGGNVEQGFAGVRYGGGSDDGLSYRAYAKGYTRGPEDHPDQNNYDDWRGIQSGFRMDWARGGSDVFTLQGDLYQILAGERVQATTYSPPQTLTADGNSYLSGGNFLGRWRRRLASGGNVEVQTYYDRTNRAELNLGERRDTFDIDFLERNPLPWRQQVSWGLGLRLSRVHDFEVVSGLTFQPDQRTDQLYTAFLQDEIGLVDQRLTLVAGTKLLRTNFTGIGLEPSARLIWTPSEKQSVWTAYTHALRTPSDAEEDFFLSGFVGSLNGLPFLARFNANHKFAPEQMNGYELGYRRLMGSKFLVDAASFYNHYHDLFDQEFAGPIFLENNPAPQHYLLPARFGNGLMGYTKGVEISPEWRPANSWRLRGSYSYLHMNLGKSPTSGDVGTAAGIVGSSPQHQVWVQSSFDLSRALELDLTYRYVSALPGQNVASYSTGDVHLAWRFSRGFELSVAGVNLFQPVHLETGGDPAGLVGIKRSGFLALRWNQ